MYDLCLTSGNTYSSFNEIYLRCYKHLDINIDINNFEYYVLSLNKKGKIIILDDKYILKDIYDIEVSISNKISILAKKEPIKLNITDSPTPPTPPTPPSPTPAKEKSLWWVWLLVGLGSLALVGGITFFVIHKQKNKNNN